MYSDIEEFKIKKKEEIKVIKKFVNLFLEQKSIKFFAFTTKDGLIIEKHFGKELDERLIGAIITKTLKICSWSTSKLDDSQVETIELNYKSGIMLIKPVGNDFIIFLLLERLIEKNKLYLELNALSYQIDSIFSRIDESQEYSEIDRAIDELKKIINKMKKPKLAGIKRLLTYIVE